MASLRLAHPTARLPRRLARGLVGGNARWAPQPSAELSAEGLERTVCAVGAALHLQRTVPSLFAHGLAVEALAVTPPTGTAHIGSSLASRLATQDTADGLRAKLGLYPSAKGLPPLRCLAPEAVHASDDFRYVFISGPPFWRAELATLSLRAGKDVVVAPPVTHAEWEALCELSAREGRHVVLYDEFAFSPAVAALREVVDDGTLGPAADLRFRLDLRPPLCCTDGHPTDDERAAPDSWWRSRARGGGALGAAGVQAVELLGRLGGAVSAVRADGDGVASEAAPEAVAFEVRFASGAAAEVSLDWRADAAGAAHSAVRVHGGGGDAILDLVTGRLDLHDGEQPGGVPIEAATARGFIDECHAVLVHELMSTQASGGDVREDSTQASYAASDAVYRSLDGGGAWEAT